MLPIEAWRTRWTLQGSTLWPRSTLQDLTSCSAWLRNRSWSQAMCFVTYEEPLSTLLLFNSQTFCFIFSLVSVSYQMQECLSLNTLKFSILACVVFYCPCQKYRKRWVSSNIPYFLSSTIKHPHSHPILSLPLHPPLTQLTRAHLCEVAHLFWEKINRSYFVSSLNCSVVLERSW